MTITIINLKSSIDQLDKDIDKTIEKELRARSLKAFADVKLMTPVDTGQARNSWYIGYTEKYFNGAGITSNITILTPKDKGQARNSWYIGYTERYSGAEATSNITILTPKDKPQEIIVTNGVTYIQFLNNGHSQQAPIKFIESAFKKYFDSVDVQVTNG